VSDQDGVDGDVRAVVDAEEDGGPVVGPEAVAHAGVGPSIVEVAVDARTPRVRHRGLLVPRGQVRAARLVQPRLPVKSLDLAEINVVRLPRGAVDVHVPSRGSGKTNRGRRSVQFRVAPCTCAPCGPSARVVRLTKSRQIPTGKPNRFFFFEHVPSRGRQPALTARTAVILRVVVIGPKRPR